MDLSKDPDTYQVVHNYIGVKSVSKIAMSVLHSSTNAYTEVFQDCRTGETLVMWTIFSLQVRCWQGFKTVMVKLTRFWNMLE